MQFRAVQTQILDRPVSGVPSWRACLLFGLGLALTFLGDFSLESATIHMGAPDVFPGVSWTIVSAFFYSIVALALTIVALIRPGALEGAAVLGFVATSVLCGSIGAIEYALGMGAFAEGLFVVGMSCAAVPLAVLWFAQATRFYSLWARRCIIAAMLMEAVVKAFVPYSIGSCWWAIGAYAGSLVLLAGSNRLFQQLIFPLPRKRFVLSVDSKPVMGFLVIALCAFAALQAITSSGQNSDLLYALSLVIATPVIWRTLAAKAFPSYSSLLKVVITLFIVAFALFSCARSMSWMLMLFALSAGVLFWFGTVTMAVDVSSYTRKSPVAILAGIYSLLSFPSMLVPIVSATLPSWGSIPDLHVLCALIVIMLAVAFIWLLSERDVDNLFAQLSSTDLSRIPNGGASSANLPEKNACEKGLSEDKEERVLEAKNAMTDIARSDAIRESRSGRRLEPGNNSPSAVSIQQDSREHRNSAICLMAQRYQLTAKEQQIVGMYAYGRSAPYIAEELVVSVNTVKSHLANAYQKIGVHSRQELISLLSEYL
ncbi:hypothetical protein B5F40_13125 [Gordonibacter sp. An230]|uniref:LuxR C-terminal-related transcriptional regulator n=1 Tax=Gordonibacter sp. An230 TaxID=1965592 RepID=UPI000B37183F|nr:LuxR C-terminal-related transcriptional regulator [Gordonibacter sp. An230]OUO88001.1 hypothetical protein B5F40_13125 [Gordonibacter sp. An230]